jgi:hypothetical protein
MLHEIPESIKSKLCHLFDDTGAWRELAEKMGYVNTATEDHHTILVRNYRFHF